MKDYNHTMDKRYLLMGYRVCFGLLAFGAIVTEAATLIERGRLIPLNFFSFFTVEANSFAVFVFILSSMALTQGKGVALLRGASTLYMAITGVFFTLLLSGLEGAEFTAVP